ncbi:MAG: peptide ABC transporter substrate-binding protein [Mycobacteriales bacterium]
MQVHKKKMRLSAVLVVLALGAAACGGSTSDSNSPDSNAGASGGTFSYTITNPENPLIPGNTNESEGAQIINALFTGLVTYDVKTSEVKMDGVAESIESDDNTLWTVKLKDGWTFHDGTPVDAQSFVDAWNYTALSTNAQGGSYFMENIQGYQDLQAETDDNDNVLSPPKADKLSGLEVVDPQTFTVQLTAPFAQYPVTVGYNAFYPLPKAFFTDPEAFGTKPIGNGPFKADEAFRQDVGFTITRFDDYSGKEKAKADAVEIKVIPDLNTAYTEVQAGGLDILDTVPPEVITTAPDEFGDRFIERSSSSFTYMGFPTYDPRYGDKKVRQAFSMAIDRAAITKAIFNDTREPAMSVVSPVVDGSRDDACKFCKYDPAAAKALLATTDFDVNQPIDLWFNAGAGHEDWVTAVGNQLRENLGITYKLRGDQMFSEYLKTARGKMLTGPFRLGWSMDYPSPQNYLEPLYTEAALPPGSNTAFYVNPAFDAKVEEGNTADSNDAAIKRYQEAEDLLLEDMPIMPMFFGKLQSVHSKRVSNVAFDAFGRCDLANVTVNQ